MLEELKSSECKFYVTGATGWVGRTFLHELQSIIPPQEFNKRVFAFGSKFTTIKSTNYPEEIIIPILPLSDLRDHPKTQNILFFHSAFLTKDRISTYGKKQFIEINQDITKTVVEFLRNCEKPRVVHISSGAALSSEKEGTTCITNADDPYSYLKLSEERQLSDIVNTQIFRIYALSGRFIRDPQVFAIGDLLTKAIKKEPLKINADFPVIRSYVSASDVAKCAIQWLISYDKPQKPIGASSHITTLVALAELIAKEYCQPPPNVKPFMHTPNSYSCSPIFFDQMLKKYGIAPLSMTDQIKDTAYGLTMNHI